MDASLEILYLFNISFSIVLLFWPLWFSRKYLRLPLINPLTITMGMFLPKELMILLSGPLLIVEKGYFNSGYQYAVLMTNILLVAQTAGLIVFLSLFKRMKIHKYLPLQNYIFSRRDLAIGAWFFLVIFFIAMYLLAGAEFGVINWLMNPRVGYQLYRVGHGHWFALAITSLSLSFILFFFSNPNVRFLFIETAFFLFLGFFIGSKTTLLIIFISTLVLLWFLKWKHLSKMILFGAPFVFALMVLNFYLSFDSAIGMQNLFEYFDHYKNAAEYYREYLAGNLNLYHGEITLSSLWSYVPRAVWPDKPFVYGVVTINEVFFPGAAELTNTPAFGGAVEQFADFGVMGVVVFGFFSIKSITAALTSYCIYVKPKISLNNISLSTLMIMIVEFAPGFGTYFPGLLYLLLLGVVVILLLELRGIRRNLYLGR